MAITDELREWWVRTFPVMDKELHEEFTAIADRIDEAHEHSIEEQEQAHNFAYSQVYEFASGIYGQLLDFDKMDEQQDAMAANGWVKLPVDADGVTIHVGDVVEYVDEPDKPRTVAYLHLANDGWWVYINGVGLRSDKYRHHHAPTVEDVLREFANEVQRCCDTADTIAEYAAKLRLSNSEE